MISENPKKYLDRRLFGLQINEALSLCPFWSYDEARGGSISRTFEFSNFRVAFAFMTQVAFVAEKFGHHPEWSNSYARVTITLTTHDAGGLSEADISFAVSTDKILETHFHQARGSI